eukprot:TRINITY_DN50088_c0_g1_i1.p1 TRINITY_DN50088_c0_g1~~TRINITY_DN50088_c0_g1_i1.p1  ORF type:complete len:234 (+),score=22.75 TRINITY_DN50088_c0_g1_i1:177-878(+)
MQPGHIGNSPTNLRHHNGVDVKRSANKTTNGGGVWGSNAHKQQKHCQRASDCDPKGERLETVIADCLEGTTNNLASIGPNSACDNNNSTPPQGLDPPMCRLLSHLSPKQGDLELKSREACMGLCRSSPFFQTVRVGKQPKRAPDLMKLSPDVQKHFTKFLKEHQIEPDWEVVALVDPEAHPEGYVVRLHDQMLILTDFGLHPLGDAQWVSWVCPPSGFASDLLMHGLYWDIHW